MLYAVAFGLIRHIRVACQRINLALEVHLHEGQLLNLCTFIGTFYIVLRRHRWIRSLYGNVLCGVDGNVYNLVCNAKTIEFRVLGSFLIERK